MPLIILCGLPSSGKTHRAKQLVSYFESRLGDDGSGRVATAHTAPSAPLTAAALTPSPSPSPFSVASPGTPPHIITTSAVPTPTNTSSTAQRPTSLPQGRSNRRLRIHHISDHTLALPRAAYATARAEKDARAALYSAVKRVLGRDDIVILDSGNYIKGWRYQLHCEAKAVSTGSCVVHVGTDAGRARGVNEARLEGGVEVGGEGEGDAYEAGVFEELVARFEEPNAMARWDSPLYTVPWDDEAPPCARIWDDMIEAAGNKDGKGRVIRPNQATALPPAAEPDHLYLLNSITLSVLNRILTYQSHHPDEPGGIIPLRIIDTSHTNHAWLKAAGSHRVARMGDPQVMRKMVEIQLPAGGVPSVAKLQGLRRQFIGLQRMRLGGAGGGGEGVDVDRCEELFVDWLNDAFRGGE